MSRLPSTNSWWPCQAHLLHLRYLYNLRYLCRIRREEEARVALEEARKLAMEMARRQAELERRLQFNRGLQVESNGLEHTQDVTRAFVFSYFELLQWLGIDISEIELMKMTKF